MDVLLSNNNNFYPVASGACARRARVGPTTGPTFSFDA